MPDVVVQQQDILDLNAPALSSTSDMPVIETFVMNKTNGKEMIEVLIEDGFKIWIPASATDLRIMNKDRELVKVKEIRVSKL